MVRYCLTLVLFIQALSSNAASILIPMDEVQKNHLKSYGLAYWTLKQDVAVDWLLNYRGGSFLIKYSQLIENECRIRGISYEVIADGQVNTILREIADPEVNMETVRLETAAKIAVYSPNNIFTDKDYTDAIQLALEYAEIPYDIVYDDEVLDGVLPKYEWLHLHHEDFTGQFGLMGQRQSQEDINIQKSIANRKGFAKVSQMKLRVAQTIIGFLNGGGYLFAMCSAGETLDVALAATGLDIVESNYDGDGIDPQAQSKLDFSKTLAFGNFILKPGFRGFSNINAGRYARPENDFFSLFSFSAKWDIVPSMLTQNHEYVIKGFNGQTTAFNTSVVKSNVLIMGDTQLAGVSRYIHGELGNGQWTYYGGHDPEGDVGKAGFRGGRTPANPADRKRDLSLTPNSPGYRLILNNVLFPSAKKKKQKT